MAVQQPKGRAVGEDTFEAMPISGLKMYPTLVKLSSFHCAIATDFCSRQKGHTFVQPVLLLTLHVSESSNLRNEVRFSVDSLETKLLR